MNKIIISGRLVRDAELSYIASTSTPKMNFSLAVERAYQKDKNNKKVDFINCEQLGKHVENLCQYVTKGKQILVEGELNIDNYEKDGEKRSFTKVKVDRLEFLSGNSNANTENKQNNEYKIEEFNDFDEDEIPF
ncbi:single-stranded DNA-binding protein [uncultured Clostridium sp.]|jgi:single-strand DNA-binding protein|uniref:single-stranded DNA-binding protein n=1 Tax=uncultured Clostridium sp. TaxID=59620 RepID=UPI0025E7C310|nr:single-stranded DNA-binding protein [uncultured Clostridium sp.]